MNRLRARGAGLLAVTLLAIGLAACQETTVSRLLAEPDRWRNKDVGLKGKVVQSMSVLGRGAFQLDDGTGTIWIVSTKGVPREGARVAVKGALKDIVDLGTLVPLPPQVGSGLVLLAEDYKAQ
jgi:membrane protein implicated in regulation of membrane protease activity